MNKIKNIILNNFITEYDSSKYEFTNEMNQLVNSITILGGFPTIIDKINSENGTVYIKCNSDFSSGSAELINVSSELKAEYEKIRP
ncbi:hypothetical protein [uncultured Formosa sp.]|uniref:hypothetical protein n=1 Tax=uncultured Formosa sp. TaxID=255435 RepID=UPI002631F680|nr:hypothetical protein [uncultured Formosa sp.]